MRNTGLELLQKASSRSASAREHWPFSYRAMAVRAPLMAIPPQGISLMHSPPMLYSTAARKTHSVPVRLFLCSMRFSPIR